MRCALLASASYRECSTDSSTTFTAGPTSASAATTFDQLGRGSSRKLTEYRRARSTSPCSPVGAFGHGSSSSRGYIARECPSLSCVMAAQAAVDSRSGPASAHSETRRPRKYSLSPMTAIRLTRAASASSLSTRNSLCAPRPGATASVPSGRSLTLLPPLRSPPRARPSKPRQQERATSRATPCRDARARAFQLLRRQRPRRRPCTPGARRTRCARRRKISPCLPLLRSDDPDDRLAGHDKHLAPPPLVVHEVRVDGGVLRLRGPDVAVVP